MTGTGLVYGSLWDDSERGGCQDFIRPLKRAQQMPWHVRSTDAWPTTATLSLSRSLSRLCSIVARVLPTGSNLHFQRAYAAPREKS